MANWIDALAACDLPTQGTVCVQINNLPLVIAQTKGQLYALLNRCPHADLPLGDGDLSGAILTCPYHGYAYNVTTGCNVDWPDQEPPCQTFAVRVHQGRVEVDLPEFPETPDEEPCHVS